MLAIVEKICINDISSSKISLSLFKLCESLITIILVLNFFNKASNVLNDNLVNLSLLEIYIFLILWLKTSSNNLLSSILSRSIPLEISE